MIYQRFAQGLNAAETRELEHLQDLATERLEAWDSQLLSDVAAMREAVERVVPHTGTATATCGLRLRDVTRSVSEGVCTTNLQFDL